MPVNHKFLNNDFQNGFVTHNAILDVVDGYEPEVLIIGTFNPDTPLNADSDFYYSRNYFWPAFKNLFTHNAVELTNRRNHVNPENPSTLEIFDMCRRLKLAFADLIKQVGHNGNGDIAINGNHLHLNDGVFNLIDDDELQDLNEIGQVNWSTNDILHFIERRPTIRYIYFTRRPSGVWGDQWNRLVEDPLTRDIYMTNIYTPAGRRIPNPVMSGLLRRWLFNDNPNFGTISHQWLLSYGVNLDPFV